MATVSGYAVKMALVGLFSILLLSAATYPPVHLDYIVAFNPPHHEYISGRFENAKAERFYFELKASTKYKRLRYHLALVGHGVQDWRKNWGSTKDYWTNSDAWKIEEMRYDYSHGGTFDLIGDKLQLYSEFVMPINRRSYNGVYYWRVGFSGRLF